jgi:2'-5' RNA ligase
VRAFLAIPVRPPAFDELQLRRERLAADVPAVRWAPADSPHVTLHFFGSISASDAERALGVLRPVLGAHPRMRLRLSGLGSFPASAAARVLWWGVAGDGAALAMCARACAEALVVVGFPVDLRPYRAHCTLGRPRQPWPARARELWWRHVDEEPQTSTFTADRVVLYESVTGAQGVRHVPRAVLPLGGGAARSVSPREDELVQLDQ